VLRSSRKAMQCWDGEFRDPLEYTRANAACSSTRLGTAGYCTLQEYVSSSVSGRTFADSL
jgi:hypothetical protein